MKIDNPQRGSYFAAQTARRDALDAGGRRSRAHGGALIVPAHQRGGDRRSRTAHEPDGVVPYVMQWPYVPDTATAQPTASSQRDGAPLREAARTLHRAAFMSSSKGGASSTTPGPLPVNTRQPGDRTVFAERLP